MFLLAHAHKVSLHPRLLLAHAHSRCFGLRKNSRVAAAEVSPKNHLELYLDCKVGGEGGPALASWLFPWFSWQYETLHCLEGRKSDFLLCTLELDLILYFFQQNVGIIILHWGPPFLKEIKMHNSSNPKTMLPLFFQLRLSFWVLENPCCHYSVDCCDSAMKEWTPVSSVVIVHCCGTGGSMHACHEAGPGSIPGRDKFPGWGFFGVFPHL